MTVLVPALGPKVSVLEANPWLFVAATIGLSVPPPAVTAKVTLVPETGLPLASVTFTTNGFASGWPAEPV